MGTPHLCVPEGVREGGIKVSAKKKNPVYHTSKTQTAHQSMANTFRLVCQVVPEESSASDSLGTNLLTFPDGSVEEAANHDAPADHGRAMGADHKQASADHGCGPGCRPDSRENYRTTPISVSAGELRVVTGHTRFVQP